ncbi:MAG: 3'-5' exonuclease, partial [Actinomycetota bacterium]
AGKREKGSKSEPISIVEALDLTTSEDLKLLDDFSAETLTRLRDAALLFRNLRSATALPLGDFVRTVAEELWIDIELRANPVRSNPLRHLMAFYDRVASFSSASAASQLSSFLSWLDFADGRERFEIPTSKPQAGTVQVMTVHSAKGLEWDAVAIPNLVEDDFPAKPKTSSGWLSQGELPFPLRGDRESLPRLDLNGVKTQSDANKAKDAFKDANREHLLREENRLIYVAITRSAKRLMLSGSYWKPGNTNPRKPSRYLLELADGFEIPQLDSQINPLDVAPKEVSWPLDPLGDSHRARLGAAEASLSGAMAVAMGKTASEFSGSVHKEIDLLLAEQDERIKRLSEIPLPVRIPASKFKDFLLDPETRASQLARPTPSEPYRATATGTEFHSWVEDVLLQQDSSLPTSKSIAELAEIFRNSRFAGLNPKEVELEINLTRGVNTFVCKLDAVFYDGDRYQIVDWKSGKAPKTEAELEAMTFQLALYRFAYSMLRGIAESEIDVLFYFVAENQEIRPAQVPSGEELMTLWEKVFG